MHSGKMIIFSAPSGSGKTTLVRHILKTFPQLPPAPIENCEALEQLRAMWSGHKIAVHVTQQAPGPGVDTPEDLARVRSLFKP